MKRHRYKRLKELGVDIDWLNDVYNNFDPKSYGKYSMYITALNSIDDDPSRGMFIERAYFDIPEELYIIHSYFEGFGYVMKDSNSGELIGKGIIDYSPFDEMELYTGYAWNIPVVHKNDYITDERKAELTDRLISHIYEICNETDVAEVLTGIGFTAREISTDCENIPQGRKCELFSLLINHLSEICSDEQDFIDVLKNLGFTDEEIETERLLNYDNGPLATDIDALIADAKRIQNTERPIKADKEYTGVEEHQMI